MPSLACTRVIQLTPPGRAAVSALLVAGPNAVRIVEDCFYPCGERRLADLATGRIALGRWGSPVGEEMIACRRSADAVEIHCHGGTAAVRAVIDALVARGCQPLDWREWVRQTSTDSIRAAAQIALADAPTERTAAVLLDQLHGALAASIQTVLAAVAAGEWPAAASTLDAVLSYREVGLHLTTPWRVVIAGRPNVGKSSLFNALVGFGRAIVCDEPGTTRDVVAATTAIDGWPVELADTAGLRETAHAIEQVGVARATAAAANADLLLLVDDTTDNAAIESPATALALRILNKIDLLTPQALADRRFDVFTSAVTGAGIAALVAAIGRALVPTPPPAGAAVPFTVEQLHRLDAARAAIDVRDTTSVNSNLQPLLR